MNVTHLLLDYPQLYDNAMKHCSRNNSYKFTHDKNIILRPANPFTNTCPAKSFVGNAPTPRLQILTHKYFRKKVPNLVLFLPQQLHSFTMPSEPSFTHSSNVSSLLVEFRYTMHDELPDVLLPLADKKLLMLLVVLSLFMLYAKICDRFEHFKDEYP